MLMKRKILRILSLALAAVLAANAGFLPLPAFADEDGIAPSGTGGIFTASTLSVSDYLYQPLDSTIDYFDLSDMPFRKTLDYSFNKTIPLTSGWIITANSMNQIVIVNVVSDVVGKTYQLTAAPYDMALDFSTGILMVTMAGSSSLAKIDIIHNTVSYISLPYAGSTIESADSGRVFVRLITGGAWWDVGICVVEYITDSIIYQDSPRFAADGALYAFDANYDYLFIGNTGTSPSTLWKYAYDRSTGALTLLETSAHGSLGSNGQDLRVSPDGEHLTFSNGGGNGNGYTVFDINPHNIAQRSGEFDTGYYPTAGYFSSDSEWYLGYNRTDIKVFSAEYHTLLSSIASIGASYLYTASGRVYFSRGDELVYYFDGNSGYAFKNPVLYPPHTISYHENGGRGSMPSDLASFGENYTIKENAFTRPGFVFTGWNTASNGSGTSYADGATIFDVQGDIILYAQWSSLTPGSYTITFNGNEGSVPAPGTGQTGADGRLSYYPTPTRSGYRFIGWFSFANGGQQIFPNTRFGSHSTIYALWGEDLHDVQSTPDFYIAINDILYHTDIDTSPMLVNEGRMDVEILAPFWPVIEMLGFTVSWDDSTGAIRMESQSYTIEMAAGEPYCAINGIEYQIAVPPVILGGRTFIPLSILTIPAINCAIAWDGAVLDITAPSTIQTPKTVSFDANGGAGAMLNQAGPHGWNCTVPANTFTRSGYSFTGWNTTSDGSGVAYKAGDVVTNIQSDITLYAQWLLLPGGGGSLGGGSSGGGGGGGGGGPVTITGGNGSVALTYTIDQGAIRLFLLDGEIKDILESTVNSVSVFDLSRVPNFTDVTVAKASIGKLVEENLAMQLNMPKGTITMDADALKSVITQAGANVTVSLRAVEHGNLTAAQQTVVGPDSLVLSISVTSGIQTVRDFGGMLTVSAAYDGPLPVHVWYLSGDGVLEEMNCTYNALTRTVTFKTNHLSLYVMGSEIGDGLTRIRLTVGALSYTVNGAAKKLDAEPSIIYGRTMVPLRFIAEALGATVDWNDDTRTAVVELDGVTLAVTIDETAPGMDVPAMIINNRTMVPLRYISETLGCDVLWEEAARGITITK